MNEIYKKFLGVKVKEISAAERGDSEKTNMDHIGLLGAWMKSRTTGKEPRKGYLVILGSIINRHARISLREANSPTWMLQGSKNPDSIANAIIINSNSGDGLAGIIDEDSAYFLVVPEKYMTALKGMELTETHLEAISSGNPLPNSGRIDFSESDNALAFIIFKAINSGNLKLNGQILELIASSRVTHRKPGSWKNKVENFENAFKFISKVNVASPGEVIEPGFTGGSEKTLFPRLSQGYKEDKKKFFELAVAGFKEMNDEQREFFVSLGFDLKMNNKHRSVSDKILSCLPAKPFLVLAGGTGTGKTRASYLTANSIAGKDSVEVIAVGADWTDNRPLLGFRNLLADGGKAYIAPPSLRIILKALGNPHKPYFLILDEMNLSHVERYFADFLSSMESKKKLKLHDSAQDLLTEDGVPVSGQIDWPKNLFVIGTVNIDETTYMFSPKVLDRAHVIEFKVTWDEIANGLEGDVPSELPALHPEQVDEFMRVSRITDKYLSAEDHALLMNVLEDLHSALEGTRFVFAHRTARECLNFIASAQALAKADIIAPQETTSLIDLAILQKALPKLNGAAGTLSKVLDELIKVCVTHGLALCKEKLESMSRQLKADQFVSFIQ